LQEKKSLYFCSMKPQDVKPKKHLGQHFLRDENIARKIVGLLPEDTSRVLEIGPGTGVLTKHLLQREALSLFLAEVDDESVEFLAENYGLTPEQLRHKDFLKMDLPTDFGEEPLAVIGNFPYNISSQIFFHVLAHLPQVPTVVGMIQKEVAERICAPHGNKTYGILSVLLQAFYETEYAFTVSEKVFLPPPKVKSAVIRLTRKRTELPGGIQYKDLAWVVKAAFGQRRKTLRNALKPLGLPKEALQDFPEMQQRAEQLSVEEFIALTQKIKNL